MRVGIIGAGPAGTLCALTLLHSAPVHARPEVLLFDGKSFLRAGPSGCNMCAGVISSLLLDDLAVLGATIPPTLVQRQIAAFRLVTPAGDVRVPRDPDTRLVTLFRSAAPRGETPDDAISFDHLLLRTARDAGADHVPAMVSGVEMPATPDAPFRLATPRGCYEVDVLVGAFGANSALGAHFETLGFGYRRPAFYHACQAELPMPEAAIADAFGDAITLFSLSLPGIRFGALTPKRRHVTVTIVGPHVKRADLEAFLQHPAVRATLPAGWEPPPVYCHCHPRLPVTAARNPVADRLLMIGDANIARYLKGGIASSFFTGALAAEMILAGRLSRRELRDGYVRPCHARYLGDNRYGRLLFGINDVIARHPAIAQALLRLVDREQQIADWHDRRHTGVLWHIFAGDAPYRRITADALSGASLRDALGELWREE
jgi:flavin-dependent dehydrogenase